MIILIIATKCKMYFMEKMQTFLSLQPVALTADLNVNVKVKIKMKFTLEQKTVSQKGSRDIALFFL